MLKWKSAAVVLLGLVLIDTASAQAPTINTQQVLSKVFDPANIALKINCVMGCTGGGTLSVTQSGTWIVQPGNTANTTPWLVTGTGGTFPVTQSGTWSNRLQDGSGNALTSTSNALDINVKSSGISNQTVNVAQIGGNSVSSTLPVSGTVSATQSGTWTVQPGNTANTTAWLVNGTGGTFPASQSGTWTVQPGNTANTTAWLVNGTGGTFPASQSGTWTVQPGNTANSTAWLVTGTGGTFPATESGSWTVTSNEAPTTAAAQALSAAAVSANSAQNIKSSAGNVYGLSFYNANTSVCWLQFYNTSGTPTCGTSVIWSIPVAASGTLAYGPGPLALQNHSTGIGFCACTTPSGSTACSTAVTGTIFYK